MEITKTHKIIISATAVSVLLLIYITFDKRLRNGNEIVNDQPVATSTDSGNVIKTNGTGEYTIEQIPITNSKIPPQPIPDLDRKVVVYAGAIIAPEATSLAIENITSLQARLKKNPLDFPAWIDLGIYQKQAGDYDGAIISWKYAGRLSPADYVSRGNLGSLYAYFLKDNAQAEIYYKEALKKGPTQTYLYIQLAEVYKDIFKDMDKARITINQGLSKIPNDLNLLQFQQTLN